MNLHTTLLTATLILFTACGGGDTSSPKYKDSYLSCQSNVDAQIFNKTDNVTFSIDNPINSVKILVTDTTPATFHQKEIYKLFQTEYYWAEETQKDFNYSTYASPQLLINQLKNKKDRWSFAITKEEYANITSQKSGGFGFKCQDVDNGCHITYVRIDSPADKIGLKRSDIITKINNLVATHDTIYKIGKKLEKLASLSIIRKNSNEKCNATITPRDYTFKVAKGRTVHTHKNEKVGYFRLDSFMGAENIVDQIDEAFDNFKKENITKLVIDLRYNGGGSVTVASKLLDKLSTTQINNEQFTLAWNDDYSKNNETYRFVNNNNSLDLKQILFLTTQASASASELVISAMKPYLSSENIVIIGDKTHGKPVGMGGKTDGNYYYFLINFVVKNSLGFYDYFEGIPLTAGCDIDDDPFHDMGDPKESMLKAALHYIDTGSCK